MSDRVADMTKAGHDASVLFIKFTRLASNKNLTICFFEGEDQKYYLVRLKLIGAVTFSFCIPLFLPERGLCV